MRTVLSFKNLFIVLVATIPFGGQTQEPDLHYLKVSNPKQLQEFFRYSDKKPVLISGHRGGIVKGYPENSIEAMENTLNYTPAFFEIDPRVTKDSVIVLMHDATLERTTSGSGRVIDYTWDELKQLRLKDKEGNLTEFRIPSLEEAIQWSKGKTILNLDKKDVPLALTAKIISELKAEAHVIVTVHNPEQARYYHELNKDIFFSAFILTKESFFEYERAGIPWSHMIAYIGPRIKSENEELIKMLNSRGVRCMISAAPTYDKLEGADARRQAYRGIVESGANIIESDLPIEVSQSILPLVRSGAGD